MFFAILHDLLHNRSFLYIELANNFIVNPRSWTSVFSVFNITAALPYDFSTGEFAVPGPAFQG
jgi:hypothetical protein